MSRDGSGNMSLSVAAAKSFFSLEMTPEGVSLRLDAASTRIGAGHVAIYDLILSVPWLNFPFDYTSGPRALRNHLTVLKAVTLEVGFDTAARLAVGVMGSTEPPVLEKGSGDSVVISGFAHDIPFSVRAGVEDAGRGNVNVRFSRPRMFGLSDTPWSAVVSELTSRLSIAKDSRVCTLPAVRRVLKPLMTGLGFKLPLMDAVILDRISVRDDRLVLAFTEGAVARNADVEDSHSLDADVGPVEPFEVLSRLPGSNRDPVEVLNFVESAIGYPVLWPEVLARAVIISNEHPELVSALLAAVLTGFENPGWMENNDLLQSCRRLLTAAENEGGRGELSRCAVLVSRVVDRFSPPDALSLLNDMRAAGLENREVLEAVAITFDRLGRHLDASTTRLRSLAMVQAASVSDAIRAMVDRMDVNGFGSETSSWLRELSELGSRGRFGAASGAVQRTAVVLLASRTALSGREDAWNMLRQVLTSSPGDPEILELMLTLAREKHEVAEAVELFQAAAGSVEGRARCDLLLTAARAMNERFGLRRRSAELLIQALEADPTRAEAASLLDDIYASLGRSAERVALAEQRLPLCNSLDDRVHVLTVMMKTAETAGLNEQASLAARSLLRLDPANIEYLRSAERIFSRAGDIEGLRAAREAMEDLGVMRASSPSVGCDNIDAALEIGDLDGAIECLKSTMESTLDPVALNEKMMQGADLCMLAGRWADAGGFLVSAAALDPAAAVTAAAAACASQDSGCVDAMVEAVREISRRSMSSGNRSKVVEGLLSGAERLLTDRPGASRSLLETAVYLEPDNLSAVMALAAVYETMGMTAEASALSGVN